MFDSSHLSPNEYLNTIPISWRPKVCPIWTDSNTDSPPSWSEIKLILKEMQGSKAPGPDALPPWLFKAILLMEEDNVSSGLDGVDSPWGKVVFKTIQLLWSCPKLPLNLMLTDIVNIPKKGESKVLPESYRGISLMQVILKILLRVLAKRLMNGLMSSQYIIREQAGFMPLEECVAQATTLYETLLKQRNRKKRGYVAFLDFRKAFDTVPHSAMLLKLSSAGVGGKLYSIIADLYANSSARVRVEPGQFTESFMIERGVRQGCPLSPILFTIFINDIFSKICSGYER